MSRPKLIRLFNLLHLSLVFIGGPLISSRRFGSYQILSHPAWQSITLGGLGLGCAGNLLAALLLAKRRQTRIAHLRWSAIHGALLILLSILFAHFHSR